MSIEGFILRIFYLVGGSTAGGGVGGGSIGASGTVRLAVGVLFALF